MDTRTAEIACEVKFKVEKERLSALFDVDLGGVGLEISQRKAKVLGVAKGSKVWLNGFFFDTDDNINQMLNETITHELCHFIAWLKFGAKGHCKEWKQVMIKAGKAPDRCAKVKTPTALNRTRVVRRVGVRCARCGKVHNVTLRMAGRIPFGEYKCGYCQMNMKFATKVQ